MKFVIIILSVAMATSQMEGGFGLPFVGNNKFEVPKVGEDVGKEFQKYTDGVMHAVKDTGGKIMNTLGSNNIGKEIKKHTDGLMGVIKDVGGKIMDTFQMPIAGNNIFGGLSSEAEQVMNNITKLRENLLNASNELLTKTENELQKIMTDINQQMNDAVNKTTSDIMTQATDLDKWKEDTVKLYEGKPQYANAEKIVNEFVKSQNENIKGCVENVLKPLQDLQANFNESAVEATNIARNVVMVAGNCTGLMEKTFEHFLNCAKGFPSTILQAQMFISLRVYPVREKLMYYGISQAAYTSCVVAMSAFINVGKGLKELELRWLK